MYSQVLGLKFLKTRFPGGKRRIFYNLKQFKVVRFALKCTLLFTSVYGFVQLVIALRQLDF